MNVGPDIMFVSSLQIKPILFTGGFGQMDARHRKKSTPEVRRVNAG